MIVGGANILDRPWPLLKDNITFVNSISSPIRSYREQCDVRCLAILDQLLGKRDTRFPEHVFSAGVQPAGCYDVAWTYRGKDLHNPSDSNSSGRTRNSGGPHPHREAKSGGVSSDSSALMYRGQASAEKGSPRHLLKDGAFYMRRRVAIF